ncbi:MAG TPA: AMP-binding protein [Verrucomicrobia bacterium]|nr:AMP-binding protein [Verrucomicrobiota bacterium]
MASFNLCDPFGTAPTQAPFTQSVSRGLPWHNLPVTREYTIGQLLDQSIARCGENDALVYPDRDFRLTWYEFGEEVDRLARGLMTLGVKRGEKIALWATNVPHWVVLMMAAAKIGAILLPLNTNYKSHELDFALKQSDAENLFIIEGYRDCNYVDVVYGLLPELKVQPRGRLQSARYPHMKRVLFLGGRKNRGMYSLNEIKDLAEETPFEAYLARQAEVDVNDVVNMQYTSGTTGFPKGVQLTHRNIANDGFWIGACQNFSARDKVCIPVPLFHCFGCVLGVMSCVNHGVTMVFTEKFDPVQVMEAVEKEKCTAVYGVPTMYIAILDHPQFGRYDFSSLRTGIMSGSACPVHRMQQVFDRMYMKEVTNPYGLTESGPVMTMTRYFEPSIERKCATIGQALPGIEVAIIDPETKELAPIGKDGEICCRGFNNMKGYYNMPEQTAACIDANGWLHSGDIGRMDAEGYYYITGRLKDIIIRGGENISPKEVEDFLGTMPGVQDVAVVGCPSKKYGEQPAAFIIRSPGATLSAADVTAFCKDKISWFKIPKYIHFVDAFPMTASQKIQKFKLREMARDLWPNA